jgi:hypothetical protein
VKIFEKDMRSLNNNLSSRQYMLAYWY